jgi:sugar-specific transcriptional regulator TrmB
MSVNNALEALGLTHIEALCYAHLAANPSTTGYGVARGIGKPTANVYRAIETLERKGLVVHDRGTPPAYRALPPAEMLARLEREFQERKTRASRELASLKPGTTDEKLYALKSHDDVIARTHLLLAAARRVVMMEAPRESLARLEHAVADARSRGVRAVVITDGEVQPAHGDTIANRRQPVRALRVAADARECVVSALPNDAGGVAEALWTRSALVARMLHDALAAEMFYALVERALDDGLSIDEVEEAFEQCRRARESV